MANGSGFQREEDRGQLHGRNGTRENEEVSEDMRVDIPGIMVLYSFPQIHYTQKKRNPPFNKAPHNPDCQFSPRSCIFVLFQKANHLESIPIFKQHLETGFKDEACLHSAFFKLIREAAPSQLASEEVEYVLDLVLSL